MRTRSSAVRCLGLGLVAQLILCMGACRSKHAASDGRPAGSAAGLDAMSNAGTSIRSSANRCRALSSEPVLVLGTAANSRGAVADPEAEEERQVELPFAVELGEARAAPHGFAVGGLESRGGATQAFVARIHEDGGEGELVELGRVFGDVEPPAVAPSKNGWVLALADSDASGRVLRLAALPPPFTKQALRRGAEITGLRRDASGFALGVSADRGVVVWSRVEQGREALAIAELDPHTAELRGNTALLVPAADADFEAPRVTLRPSGYYLAYVVRSRAPRESLRPVRDAADAGSSESLLDEGPSAVEIVPLDAQGKAAGSARRVTPPSARVIAFELASTADGGALLIYGDDQHGPGLETPQAHAVWIRPDGSTESRTWELGPTPGLPSVLTETAPVAKPWGWIAVPGEHGMRVAAMAGEPLAFAELQDDPELSNSELLAVNAGRMLRSRPRGTQRELSLVDCVAMGSVAATK